jgi:hypothetical protein
VRVRLATVLWLLCALFAVRVVAQPLSRIVSFLPPFESWHSAAIPYQVLLASQVAILVALASATWGISAGTTGPKRSRGVVALMLGTVYFLSMAVRLVLGFTIFSDVRWFASPLPTIFHLVLASWLLLYGSYHVSNGADPPSGR